MWCCMPDANQTALCALQEQELRMVVPLDAGRERGKGEYPCVCVPIHLPSLHHFYTNQFLRTLRTGSDAISVKEEVTLSWQGDDCFELISQPCLDVSGCNGIRCVQILNLNLNKDISRLRHLSA